jgi:hypothetical protein
MIAMEAAVAAAMKDFRTLYPQGVKDPLLEEIEMSDDEKYWNVTIGFNVVESVPPSLLEEAMANAGRTGPALADRKRVVRKFKQFHMNAQNGMLVAMRNKE